MNANIKKVVIQNQQCFAGSIATNEIKALNIMNKKQLDFMYEAQEKLADLPPIPCVTEHILHSGVYTRTVFLPKGGVIVGVKMKIPTTLILSGHMSVYIGEEVYHFKGYKVLPTLGERKQMMFALEDSYITLSFKTDAKTIEEAENEMTDEADTLLSRKEDSHNLTTITGV